jgi:hypothetical protein
VRVLDRLGVDTRAPTAAELAAIADQLEHARNMSEKWAVEGSNLRPWD